VAGSQSFTVAPFTPENFFKALVEYPCTEHDAAQGHSCTYLVDYLKEIGSTTIVTELVYVDADYLDDYANFYAKSFEKIPNRCRRLHFFKTEIKDDSEFLQFVRAERDAKELQDNYLGFIVARPLPTPAVIGRTALATYPPDNGRRNYPTLRPYHVHLFGVDLTINSLAFQVQDTSLAACATVALWSCFQKTQDIFKSPAPTPVAITRSANRYNFSARPFPSRFLQIQQICYAITAIGLDPEVYTVNPALPLASLIYSYLQLGLPVLLIVDIPGAGGHAIALTGYSLKETEQLTSEGGGVGANLPKMIGSRINEFYGHDDQKGCFARLRMEAPSTPTGNIMFKDTGWGVDLIPLAVVVPIYPKIRTGFREVIKYLPQISVLAAGGGANPTQFEWDVFLTSGNEFKKVLRNDQLYTNHARRESLLIEGFPKYVWRCILRVDKKPFVEMLLDTTAMVHGFAVCHILWHETGAQAAIRQFLQAHEALLAVLLGPKLIEAVKKSL
jgi:hypothetical protein